MKGLLYKDFMLFRKSFFALGLVLTFVILCGISVTLLAFSSSVPNEETVFEIGYINAVIYMCAFIILPSISSQLFTPDEKPASLSFLFSTPQGAKGQIQSKYYFLLLVNMAILLVCFLADTVTMLIMGEYASSFSLVCVIYFCLGLILLAIRIPFTIRFGSNHSFEAQIVYITLFTAIIYIYGLFDDISFFFREGGLSIKAIAAYFKSEKVIFVLSFIPYISVLLYYLSYRISLALYRKGVENYEQ